MNRYKKWALAAAIPVVAAAAFFGFRSPSANAAPAVIREQQSAATNQTAITFTLGATSAVGDTVILIQTNNWYTAANLQTPQGTAVTNWALRNTLDLGTNKGHIKVWEGVITGSGTKTVQVKNSTLDEERYAQLVVVGGGVYDGSTFNSGLSTANHVAPSLTPSQPDDLLLTTWEGIGQSFNYTVPATMTAFTERDITGFITARSASQQLTSGSATGTRTATASVVTNSFMAASVLVKSTGEPPPTTPPATTAPATTPPATTPPPTTPPPSGGWPDASNTGVPDGTILTNYTGSCTISTANTVIDSKTMNCNVVINANGVTIKNSRVNGTVSSSGSGAFHFELIDSEVDGTPGAPQQVTSVGSRNFLILRSEITGGNRSVFCERDCTIQDSWLHGQELAPVVDWHLSAVRLSQYSTLIHNTLSCDAPPNPPPSDGGCSANQTGYPDFEPTTHWTVRDNLFKGNPGVSYCAYSGNTQGKPYSTDPTNATYIVYENNTFERGVTGRCGAFGPDTDFAAGHVGNIWTGNVWDTGGVVSPG